MVALTRHLLGCAILVASLGTTANGQMLTPGELPLLACVPAGASLWRLPRGPGEQTPLLERLQDVVGPGQWKYAWPHNTVPQKIPGYRLVSSPVFESEENRGCTINNWGQLVVFQSLNTETQVSVKCHKDYTGSKGGPGSQPWVETHLAPTCLERVEFLGLKAGMIAWVPNKPPPPTLGIPATAAGGVPPPLRPTAVREAYFVFRLGNTVVCIHAEDRVSAETAWNVARDVGRAIYAYRPAVKLPE